MCEMKSGGAFYQTTRMSLSYLKFVVESVEMESRWTCNRFNRKLVSCDGRSRRRKVSHTSQLLCQVVEIEATLITAVDVAIAGDELFIAARANACLDFEFAPTPV